MNPFNNDAFPYLQQMTQQFRQIFGDDFVRNLMQSMQSPGMWAQGNGPNATGNGRGARFDGGPAGQPFQGAGGPGQWPGWNMFNQGQAPSPNVAPSGAFPPCDVYETRHEVILVFEVPGMERASDVKISILPEQVTIRGEADRNYGKGERTLYMAERYEGAFERKVTLPARVRKQHAKATYRQGLLEVRLLKENKAQDADASMIDIDFLS